MNLTPPAQTKKRAYVSFGNIALLLVATAFAGQLLGFLRTRLIGTNFPPAGPQSTDAYFAAFIIPDFFYFTIAAGALGVAFMPILSDHLHKGDKKGAWELSASLLNLLALLMFGVAVIILLFANPMMHLLAPKLHGEQFTNATTIMRLLAFNPLLFTISGILTSVQQTLGRFFFYAIAPLLYNLSIIVSIFLFKHNIGIVGLGVGALLGGILQLVVILIGNRGMGYRWKPVINFKNPDFKQALRNLPPRSLDQGVDQLNGIVETHIANTLGPKNISFYNFAYTLSTAPVLLIGTAISTAAFPRLNRRLSQGRPDLFRQDFLRVLQTMVWIIAPVAVVSFFARGYLARLILGQTAQTVSVIFGYLIAAIVFRTLYAIISRWFYAQKDTKTPLFVSIFTISLNIILAFSLAKPNSYGVAGLALAQSIVAMVEVFILGVIMLKRDNKLFDGPFWEGIMRIISVSGFTIVAGYLMVTIYPLSASDKGFFALGGKLCAIAAVVIGVHILMSAIFDLDEVRPLFKRVRKISNRVLKPIKLDY